ncbi:592_t:CDS:1, partial [Paraglomus occultum]
KEEKEIQETQSEESSSIHSEITNATSTLTPLLRTYSLGRPVRSYQGQLEINQEEIISTFIQSPNVDSFSEGSQFSAQMKVNQRLEELKGQILVLNDKISTLEREKKDLQETNESLRTSLNNYVNSLLDSLIQEQENFNVDDDNLSIYLKNQQRTIDNLEESLGKELNSEQSRNLRGIQKQLAWFREEQMKRKLERLEEQLQNQILVSPK